MLEQGGGKRTELPGSRVEARPQAPDLLRKIFYPSVRAASKEADLESRIITDPDALRGLKSDIKKLTVDAQADDGAKTERHIGRVTAAAGVTTDAAYGVANFVTDRVGPLGDMAQHAVDHFIPGRPFPTLTAVASAAVAAGTGLIIHARSRMSGAEKEAAKLRVERDNSENAKYQLARDAMTPPRRPRRNP